MRICKSSYSRIFYFAKLKLIFSGKKPKARLIQQVSLKRKRLRKVCSKMDQVRKKFRKTGRFYCHLFLNRFIPLCLIVAKMIETAFKTNPT